MVNDVKEKSDDTKPQRLDALLYARGLAESRAKAKRFIQAGQVLVNDRVIDKVATQVAPDACLEVRRGLPYVSRGGFKLEKALATFSVDPADCVVADVGASTGGFTDLVLQRGAVRVYAIDAGYGQLDWKLRQDGRVVVMERTNARYVETLPEPIDLVTVDVSFISLRLILPMVARWLAPEGNVIALVKPQFEAGKHLVGKGGVVRDPKTHRMVLHRVLTFAAEEGWRVRGLTCSPIKGPKGNIEYLIWLDRIPDTSPLDIKAAIDETVAASRR